MNFQAALIIIILIIIVMQRWPSVFSVPSFFSSLILVNTRHFGNAKGDSRTCIPQAAHRALLQRGANHRSQCCNCTTHKGEIQRGVLITGSGRGQFSSRADKLCLITLYMLCILTFKACDINFVPTVENKRPLCGFCSRGA